MTLLSEKSDAEYPMVYGSHPDDFASRVNSQLGSLQARVEHPDAQFKGVSVRLMASVGVATLSDVAGSAEDLLKAVVSATYTNVKDSGKNDIHVAEGNI